MLGVSGIILFSASVFCSVGILFRLLVVGWLLSVVCLHAGDVLGILILA